MICKRIFTTLVGLGKKRKGRRKSEIKPSRQRAFPGEVVSLGNLFAKSEIYPEDYPAGKKISKNKFQATYFYKKLRFQGVY